MIKVGLTHGFISVLSAYGDTELVMKGVNEGACDYLLKPVRMEELKNIWQHVIRKKKADPNNSHNAGHRLGVAGNQDANDKCKKKRKDQVDDEDHDQNGTENDGPSSQKKSRVVWSADLHSKFVAAVIHLGVDAVPKRILELMNVENLTRENVASHLQKYKICLRRISCVQRQDMDMVAAVHNTDHSFSTVHGMGRSYSLLGTPQFKNGGFTSFPHDGMLRDLNSSVSLGIQHQVNHTHLSEVALQVHAADRGAASIPRISNGHVLNGRPISYEINQLQEQDNNTSVSYTGEVPVNNDHWLVAVQPPADQLLPDDASSISELPLSVADYKYQGSHSTSNIIGHEEKHHCDRFAAAPMRSSNLMPRAGSSSVAHSVIASGLQVIDSDMPNTQGNLNINVIKRHTYVDSFPSYLYRGYQIDERKPLVHRLPNNAGSLEDVVSSVVKPPVWDSNN